MSFEYCKTYRHMTWLKRGLRVTVQGKEGKVTSEDGVGYLRIRINGEKTSRRYHPQWETVYHDDGGTILADYRKKDTQ